MAVPFTTARPRGVTRERQILESHEFRQAAGGACWLAERGQDRIFPKSYAKRISSLNQYVVNFFKKLSERGTPTENITVPFK